MTRRWIDEPALTHLPDGEADLDTSALTFDL